MEKELAAIVERLDTQERRLARHDAILFGDDRELTPSLLSRVAQLEKYIDELQELIALFRVRLDTSIVFIRAGLWLIALVAGGVWWPYIDQVLHLVVTEIQHGP